MFGRPAGGPGGAEEEEEEEEEEASEEASAASGFEGFFSEARQASKLALSFQTDQVECV